MDYNNSTAKIKYRLSREWGEIWLNDPPATRFRKAGRLSANSIPIRGKDEKVCSL